MKLILPIILSLFSLQLFGQRNDLSTIYRNNWTILNPAASNSLFSINKSTSISVSGRGQISSIEGAPFNGNIGFEKTLIYDKKQPQNIKFGGSIHYNQAGALGNILTNGNFAYYLMNEQGKYLSVGINMGFNIFRFDQFHKTINAKDNNSFLENFLDGNIRNLNQNQLNFGVGLFYRSTNIDYRIGRKNSNLVTDWYLGISLAPQFSDFPLSDKKFNFNRKMEVHTVAGFVVPLIQKYQTTISIEPTLWVRYSENFTFYQQLWGSSSISGDFNLKFLLNDKFWLGSGLNSAKIVHFEVGGKVNNNCNNCQGQDIEIGIAYDIPFTSFNPLGNMLELSLNVGL